MSHPEAAMPHRRFRLPWVHTGEQVRKTEEQKMVEKWEGLFDKRLREADAEGLFPYFRSQFPWLYFITLDTTPTAKLLFLDSDRSGGTGFRSAVTLLNGELFTLSTFSPADENNAYPYLWEMNESPGEQRTLIEESMRELKKGQIYDGRYTGWRGYEPDTGRVLGVIAASRQK